MKTFWCLLITAVCATGCHTPQARLLSPGEAINRAEVNRIGGPKGERLHGTDKGHEFGRDLLDEIDRKVAHVIRMMRKFTAQSTWRDEPASVAAQRELRARLAELRSEKAMED